MRDIITGVDNADAAPRVLERALSEAETTHRPLRVLTVWSTPVMVGDLAGFGYAGVALSSTEIRRSSTELGAGLLDKALHERRSQLPVEATSEALPGDPGRVLVAASKDAGLLILGGRSHGGLGSALLGSATGYAVHHTSCPVMVVPESAAPGPFHRVIVGMDDEGCSRSALRWALDAAARHGCPLHVIHAVNLLPIPGANVLYPDYEIATRAWLRNEIAEVLTDRREVAVTNEVVQGQAARALLDRAGPDDLLVVGSRGRGGFVDLLLGSVATLCSTHAHGPVVVVREDQERLEI